MIPASRHLRAEIVLGPEHSFPIERVFEARRYPWYVWHSRSLHETGIIDADACCENEQAGRP